MGDRDCRCTLNIFLVVQITALDVRMIVTLDRPGTGGWQCIHYKGCLLPITDILRKKNILHFY